MMTAFSFLGELSYYKVIFVINCIKWMSWLALVKTFPANQKKM